MNTKKITLDNKEYTLFQLPVFQASDLERRLVNVLFPVLADFIQDIDISKGKVDTKDFDFNFAKMADGFRKGIGALSKDDYTNLIIDCLSRVQTKDNKGTLLFLDSEMNINNAIPKTKHIYQLIFEVCKHNGMVFFELMAGLETQKTDS